MTGLNSTDKYKKSGWEFQVTSGEIKVSSIRGAEPPPTKWLYQWMTYMVPIWCPSSATLQAVQGELLSHFSQKKEWDFKGLERLT